MRSDSKKRRSCVVSFEPVSAAAAASLRQPDGGVELQHNIVAVRTYAGDSAGDAVGLRYGVVDRVSQFTQQVFQVIIELQGGLPYLCRHFRLTLHWIQARLGTLSPKGSQPFVQKICAFGEGLAIHYAPDSALRCCCGHIKPRSAASASGNRFSPPLAGSQAAFSRSDWRGVRGFGAGVAQRRVPGVTTRRGAPADRAGDLRCRAVWFLFHNTIPSRAQSALNVCLKRNHHRRNRKSGGEPFTT